MTQTVLVLMRQGASARSPVSSTAPDALRAGS